MASESPHILRVGDTARVDGHGDRVIRRIDVCLRPSTDPAGEEHFAKVDAVELGEFGPPFVVMLDGGGWAYGIQVQAVLAGEPG